MAKKTDEKQKPMQQLFVYAGGYRYLTMASWVLAVISAFMALVPFYFIWRLIQEVLRVAPDMGKAQNLSSYGWSAVFPTYHRIYPVPETLWHTNNLRFFLLVPGFEFVLAYFTSLCEGEYG